MPQQAIRRLQSLVPNRTIPKAFSKPICAQMTKSGWKTDTEHVNQTFETSHARQIVLQIVAYSSNLIRTDQENRNICLTDQIKTTHRANDRRKVNINKLPTHRVRLHLVYTTNASDFYSHEHVSVCVRMIRQENCISAQYRIWFQFMKQTSSLLDRLSRGH